jgi:hypothetical protein
MSSRLDRVQRNPGAGHFNDAPVAQAGNEGTPRAAHEARVRALSPPLHAALQIAGRAVGARAHDAGPRARAQGGMDPAPLAAPAWGASAAPADAEPGSPAGLQEGRPNPMADVLHRQDAGSGRDPGRGRGRGGGGGGEGDPGRGGGDPASSAQPTSRRDPPGDGQPAPTHRRGAAAAGTAHPQCNPQAEKDQAIATALSREYDTELALLQRRRKESKAALSGGMQHAVLDHNHAMLRVLQELLQQLDADFNALEAALLERISQAWVASAPASAKAPRPGARTPAEQREVNELLQLVRKRRSGARRLLHDSVRAACLRRATGALGIMMEWYRNIEDELLDLELHPVTTRQRQAEARFAQARTQRDQARLQLGHDIRATCEADPAGMLGLLVELRLAMEEHHHGRLQALRPR